MWINRPTPTIPDWSRPDLFIGEPPLLIISQPTKNCKLPMHHTKKSAHALSPIWSQCPLKAALPPKALVQHPNFSHPSHVLSIYISLSLSLIVGHPHTHTHTACMQANAWDAYAQALLRWEGALPHTWLAHHLISYHPTQPFPPCSLHYSYFTGYLKKKKKNYQGKFLK